MNEKLLSQKILLDKSADKVKLNDNLKKTGQNQEKAPMRVLLFCKKIIALDIKK